MKSSTRHMERTKPVAPVLPTTSLRQHGYDLEEGSHSARDAELLEQDGQQDNGIPVRRILSGVRRLYQDGKITGGDAAAAEKYAADYALGILGAMDPERRGSSCRGDLHAFQVARLDAASRYREAKSAIGAEADHLLQLFVVQQKGMAAIARQLASAETAPVKQGATKKAATDREATVIKKSRTRAEGLCLRLIAAVKDLSDFYAKQAGDRTKAKKSYWRPELSEPRSIDPATGKQMVLYPTVYDAVRARVSQAAAA